MGKRKIRVMSESLRRAISTSGKTLYRISKDTGISYSPLWRFMHGQTGLRLDLLDKLCAYLGLDLTSRE
jgi:hypothetical protein